MRKYILAGLFAVLAFSAAQAADTAAPAAKPAAVAAKPAGFNWSGVYGGLNLGYAWGTSTYFADVGTHATTTVKSIIGGAQLGWDHAVGAFLWGIGGSLEGGKIAGKTVCPGPAFTCVNDYDFLATATGRVGIVVGGNGLVYAKGGFVAGDYHLVLTRVATGALYEQQQLWATGWTAGAGLEHVLRPNLTLFGEYDYYSLTSASGSPTCAASVVATSCAGLAGLPDPTARGHDTAGISSVLVGLNWR